MKNLLSFIVLFSSFSTAANSTMIVTGDTKIGPIIGFSDSSFNYKANDTKRERKFCYVGNVNEVCDLVKEAALKMNSNYYGGAHDRIELQSCITKVAADEYETDEVTVKYNLSDDYGSDFDVTRTIRECARI